MAELSMRPDEDLNSYGARLRDLYSNGQITAEEYFAAGEKETARLYLSGA